jgi:hypothetical protein
MPCITYSMSFDPALTYRQWLPSQAEILQYLHDITTKYRVDQRLTLNAEFVDANWNDKTKLWTVTYKNLKTSELYEQESRFLISAIGQLVEPIYGGIQGLEHFEGDVLHCNRWDNDVSLDDKNVVVIGNGGKLMPTLILIPLNTPSYSMALSRNHALTLISVRCTGNPIDRTTSAKLDTINQNTTSLLSAKKPTLFTTHGMDV